MHINIHWGEFIGPVKRTEVRGSSINKETGTASALYKYDIDLRGYIPFALFKNIRTNKWLSTEEIQLPVSAQVIYYTKKILDEYEDKYSF